MTASDFNDDDKTKDEPLVDDPEDGKPKNVAKPLTSMSPIVNTSEGNNKASFAEMIIRWEQKAQQRRETAAKNLLELCQQLEALGAATVEVEYDGSGDAGEIVSFVTYDKEGNSMNLDSHQSEVEELAHDLSPSGYEDNDGGYGTVTLYVDKRQIEQQHNQRHTEFNAYGYTLDDLSGNAEVEVE